jgi:hypothetical protein
MLGEMGQLPSRTMFPKGKWTQVFQGTIVCRAIKWFSSMIRKKKFKFSSILCNIFFNLHCEMLLNMDEKYIMNEILRQMKT